LFLHAIVKKFLGTIPETLRAAPSAVIKEGKPVIGVAKINRKPAEVHKEGIVLL